MRFVLFLSVWVLSLGIAPAMLLLQPAPAQGVVMVLHSPWTDGARLVETAGGRPIGVLQAPMATMADGGPDFIASVRRAGAWGVSDARLIAQICGVNL
ncbi:hypothetical protein NBRC116596_02930 [Litorivita sp. NS0012-18]